MTHFENLSTKEVTSVLRIRSFKAFHKEKKNLFFFFFSFSFLGGLFVWFALVFVVVVVVVVVCLLGCCFVALEAARYRSVNLNCRPGLIRAPVLQFSLSLNIRSD